MLILPYFGRFNNYFPLFLRSCGANLSVDFLVFTDDTTPYEYPGNVKVAYMTFNEFKARAVRKLGFEPCLPSPYKLCDFKPAYGLLFEDYLDGYDYWGHCDCDLIFGDLGRLLMPVLDQGYDKIFAAGHLTLYRNTPENNRRFMKPLHGREIYREAFTTPRVYVFDEDNPDPGKNPGRNNVHAIFLEDSASVFCEDLSMNVSMLFDDLRRSVYSPQDRSFHRPPTPPTRYYWDNGRIIGVSWNSIAKSLECHEYLYMHFHSRALRMPADTLTSPLVEILPDRFRAVRSLPGNRKDMHLLALSLPSAFRIHVMARRIRRKLRAIVSSSKAKIQENKE